MVVWGLVEEKWYVYSYVAIKVKESEVKIAVIIVFT